jgi:hypothetical protein
LIHVGAFNLSLIFRTLLGSGTPRELKNRQSSLIFVFFAIPPLLSIGAPHTLFFLDVTAQPASESSLSQI